MDTSVEASDVSLSDFSESRKGTRKRKRKIAPLKFEEDPLDATFYSPDRPRAVPNPIGAPAVDVLGQTNSWILLDEFGRPTASRQLPRRRPPSSRVRDDVITCSRSDCAHPLHVHSRVVAKIPINISDNDSDLLISIDDDQSNMVTFHTNSPSSSSLIERKTEILNTSTLKDSDSGIGKTQRRNSISGMSPDHQPIELLNNTEHTMDCTTPVIKSPDPDNIIQNLETSYSLTPNVKSPSFQKVGFSQCKPGKTVKRTRLIGVTESCPDPVYEEKDNLRRRVVFESPRTPVRVGLINKPPVNAMETPESKSGEILVEDTPEHLVGLRMVTRRLRRVLKQTVPDSLNF